MLPTDELLSKKLEEAEAEVGDSKVRVGLWVAENVEPPAIACDPYESVIAGLRTRGLAS